MGILGGNFGKRIKSRIIEKAAGALSFRDVLKHSKEILKKARSIKENIHILDQVDEKERKRRLSGLGYYGDDSVDSLRDDLDTAIEIFENGDENLYKEKKGVVTRLAGKIDAIDDLDAYLKERMVA